jgi:hypothetical protein
LGQTISVHADDILPRYKLAERRSFEWIVRNHFRVQVRVQSHDRTTASRVLQAGKICLPGQLFSTSKMSTIHKTSPSPTTYVIYPKLCNLIYKT